MLIWKCEWKTAPEHSEYEIPINLVKKERKDLIPKLLTTFNVSSLDELKTGMKFEDDNYIHTIQLDAFDKCRYENQYEGQVCIMCPYEQKCLEESQQEDRN